MPPLRRKYNERMKALLDLRFADDLLVFATSRDDTIRLLEELVTSLGKVGLTLNASKTKILTTQAQPGNSLQTNGGVTLEILDNRCAQKWLGCMLQAAQGGKPSADLQHHLQAASRAFHAHRSILTNHQVSFKDRHTFFHAVVTPVACFAAGHRKIFKQELAALDVAHRKLLRRVVGPPAGMDWSLLHGSNGGVLCFFPRRLLACGSGCAGSKPQHLISFSRVGECLEGKRHPHVRSLLGSSHCQTPHSSLEQIKKSFATRQAKALWGGGGKTRLG